MVVAGTSDAVLMVESEAKELTEDQMLGAVLFAHDEFQAVIQAINELAARSWQANLGLGSASRTPSCWAPSAPSSAKRSPRLTPSPSRPTATRAWAS
jgi:hypothetical protein